MLNNDIDNGIPRRVLVNIDVVMTRVEEKQKRFWLFTRTVEQTYINKTMLAALWNYSTRMGVVIELFAVGEEESFVEGFLNWLDEHVTHPFRSGSVTPDLRVLVSELAYRPDILGVVDLPERGLRYGSRWLDPRQL